MNKINSNHLIIVAAAALMQWHSIQFWVSQVGLSGVGWSLMLESVVIWFWWNNRNTLALIASLLLITGPVIEITNPAISQIKTQQQYKILDAIDEYDILRLEKSLKTYEKNSELRVGWSSRIDRTQNRINENYDRIRERNTEKSDFDLMLSGAIAIAQALALLMIMTAQALAISEQRRKAVIENQSKNDTQVREHIETIASATTTKLPIGAMWDVVGDKEGGVEIIRRPATEKEKTAEPENTEKEANEIPENLRKVLNFKGITQGQWCQQHQINQKHLSLAKSHSRLIREGKETAPVAKLRKIITTLKIETQKIEKEPS